jgi:hypothetical protein
MNTLRLEVPDPGVGWLNLNRRLHRLQVAARTKAWREATTWRAKAAKLPRFTEPVRILAFVCPTTARKFDATNLLWTAKACVDGLRDAGVLVDDDNDHVLGPDMRCGPKRKTGTLVLVITTVVSAEEALTE